MIAVDTNVLIRLITDDDPAQVRRARRLFEHNRMWIAKTVVLETEWVLRSLYGFGPEAIAAALTTLAGLANVEIEDRAVVAKAITWMGQGLDFADGLHLASCPAGHDFVTFDARLVRRATRLGISAREV